MTVVLNNNATGTLAQGISASAVQLQLSAGDGAAFPDLGVGDWFFATLVSPGGALEIVKATYRIADLVGIVRAQEGTLAQSFPAGSRFELRVTVGNVTALIPEPQITVSSTPPPNPALDDLWLETSADNPSGEAYAPVDHTHSDMVTLAGTQIITGAKTFSASTGSTFITARKATPTSQAALILQSEAGYNRFITGLAGVADDDFFIGRYSETGVWQGSVMYVPGATGVPNFLTTPTVDEVAVSLTGHTHPWGELTGFPTTIELGHDTDTTLTRKAAGVVGVEGKAVITHNNTAYVSAGVTVSTVAPSGGADGDIWLVVA